MPWHLSLSWKWAINWQFVWSRMSGVKVLWMFILPVSYLNFRKFKCLRTPWGLKAFGILAPILVGVFFWVINAAWLLTMPLSWELRNRAQSVWSLFPEWYCLTVFPVSISLLSELITSLFLLPGGWWPSAWGQGSADCLVVWFVPSLLLFVLRLESWFSYLFTHLMCGVSKLNKSIRVKHLDYIRLQQSDDQVLFSLW